MAIALNLEYCEFATMSSEANENIFFILITVHDFTSSFSFSLQFVGMENKKTKRHCLLFIFILCPLS